MSYVRDTRLARARQRRQRRSLAIVAVAVVLVITGLAFALFYMTSFSIPPTAATSCAVSTQAPAPQTVFVLNIYNASSDTGRAKRIATAMKSRDFHIGVVSNDPYGENLKGVGQIRYGPVGTRYAKDYIKQYTPGGQLIQDGRTDTSVDLVLGEQAPAIGILSQALVSLPVDCSTR